MKTKGEKPIVAITVGDFNGIGPEVIIKSISHGDVWKVCKPIVVGPLAVFRHYAEKYRLPFHNVPLSSGPFRWKKPATPIINSVNIRRSEIIPGRTSERAGFVSVTAIETAVQLVRLGIAHAIVTGPVSKKAMHLAGVDFPGQTELLQHLTLSKRVAMMLVSDEMRVGLATIHLPIRDVARTLTRDLLRNKITTIHDALKADWRIAKPRIAVLALNPHASEEGDIGREDIDIVAPTIRKLRGRRMKIEGPFPADGFFANYRRGMFDGIVAMYHDQGLIPLKMTARGEGVNISAGLNVVRTSPDHGTAFDIAGKNIADPRSMIEAIKLAALVAHNRGIVRKSD